VEKKRLSKRYLIKRFIIMHLKGAAYTALCVAMLLPGFVAAENAEPPLRMPKVLLPLKTVEGAQDIEGWARGDGHRFYDGAVSAGRWNIGGRRVDEVWNRFLWRE
jgi:hypothetical protein